MFFVELQNVYNRKNVFQCTWNPKTRQRGVIDQIAFLPLGEVNVEF